MATVQLDFDADFFPVRQLGLKAIKVDHDVQSRVRTDPEHVAKIVVFLKSRGPISEPVIVFFDGKNYWLADGFHRVEAHRQLSREKGFAKFGSIMAEIRPGTRQDAIVYSAGANQEKTYLKRTPEDVRRALGMLLELSEWRYRPASEIGKAIGLCPSAVQKHRKEFLNARGLPLLETIVTSNGRRVRYPKRRLNIDPHHALRIADPPAQPWGKSFARHEDSQNIVESLRAAGIDSISAFTKGDMLSYLWLRGLDVQGIAVVWESFRNESNVTAAIGRAVCCRAELGASRAVVLCPVQDGPAEVLELGRKAGVEFMTIEDFVASLKGADE